MTDLRFLCGPEMIDAFSGRDDDAYFPWPPYGVSVRDETEQDWWERCPLHDEQMRGGYCPVCGRRGR